MNRQRGRAIQVTGFLLLLAAFGAATSVVAQTAAPEFSDRPQQPLLRQLQSTLLSIQQNADVGTLEFVERSPEPDTISIYTAQSFYHTDNVFLSAPFDVETDVWMGAFGISYVPYSTARWTPRFTFETALVRYCNASSELGIEPTDYIQNSIGFDSRLGLTHNNMLSWNFGISALRADGQENGVDDFYKRIRLANNLNWYRPLNNKGSWLFNVSPGVVWTIADPEEEENVNAGLLFAVLWVPTRNLVLQPFVEGSYSYYPEFEDFDDPSSSGVEEGRHDFAVRTGLSMVWTFSRHASVAMSAYWLNNWSSLERSEYNISPYVTLGAQVGF